MHFRTGIKLSAVIVVLLLSGVSCTKTTYSDDTWSGSKVMILGHRGMGEMYKMPGNTWEAIAPAIAIGTDGCEIDIQLTKDTVLVLYHDHTLNSRTTCTGRIYESDWEQIKQCRYSPALQSDLYITAADDLFGRLPEIQNLYFSFDCSKVDNDTEDTLQYRMQYLRAIKRLCDKYDMTDHVFLEGDADLLKLAQSLGLKNRLFLFGVLDNDYIETAGSNHFFGISTSIDWLYVDIERAHEKGLYVMVWSPNNESQNKFALKAGADIIQTDDPISILKLLNRYNYEYIIP